MKTSKHARVRIFERADGDMRYINEILRTRNPKKFFPLPRQTNNKRVAAIQLPEKKIVVVYSKNAHKIITVLAFERYIREHNISNEICRKLIEAIG